STRAGGAEVRSRCARSSSTRAGPFDAVIDFVRSQRLESSACLLLPPALRLPRALLRCLRCLPSLLRHAALLAMSEWRCRTVPAGIANTALRITTAEQKHQHFRRIERDRMCIDTTSCVSTSAIETHEGLHNAIALHRAKIFSSPQKHRYYKGFSTVSIFRLRRKTARTSVAMASTKTADTMC